jgi:hypothetical protein
VTACRSCSTEFVGVVDQPDAKNLALLTRDGKYPWRRADYCSNGCALADGALGPCQWCGFVYWRPVRDAGQLAVRRYCSVRCRSNAVTDRHYRAQALLAAVEGRTR